MCEGVCGGGGENCRLQHSFPPVYSVVFLFASRKKENYFLTWFPSDLKVVPVYVGKNVLGKKLFPNYQRQVGRKAKKKGRDQCRI